MAGLLVQLGIGMERTGKAARILLAEGSRRLVFFGLGGAVHDELAGTLQPLAGSPDGER
jgi:hypothetical protein